MTYKSAKIYTFSKPEVMNEHFIRETAAHAYNELVLHTSSGAARDIFKMRVEFEDSGHCDTLFRGYYLMEGNATESTAIFVLPAAGHVVIIEQYDGDAVEYAQKVISFLALNCRQ